MVGTGTSSGPVRQRLADAARRDAQLCEIARAHGRIGALHDQRAAPHPHRISVRIAAVLGSVFLFFFRKKKRILKKKYFSRFSFSSAIASRPSKWIRK